MLKVKKLLSSSIHSLRSKLIIISIILYVAASLTPMSILLGETSTLSFDLMLTPVLAILLQPFEVFLSVLLGSLIPLLFVPNRYALGILSIVSPVIAATLGSLLYHKSKFGSILTIVTFILLLEIITFQMGVPWGFPSVVTLYILALLLVLVLPIKWMPEKAQFPFYIFITAMCEDLVRTNLAIYMQGGGLEFLVQTFTITYERIFIILGAGVIVYSLYKIGNIKKWKVI